jgi:hypothetical protein
MTTNWEFSEENVLFRGRNQKCYLKKEILSISKLQGSAMPSIICNSCQGQNGTHFYNITKLCVKISQISPNKNKHTNQPKHR